MSIIARLHSKLVMIISTVTLAASNETTAQTVALCVLPPDVCPIGNVLTRCPNRSRTLAASSTVTARTGTSEAMRCITTAGSMALGTAWSGTFD